MKDKPKPKKTKRKYNQDPLNKIRSGKNWKFPFEPEKEVAEMLVKEQQDTGANYSRLINKHLRACYKIAS